MVVNSPQFAFVDRLKVALLKDSELAPLISWLSTIPDPDGSYSWRDSLLWFKVKLVLLASKELCSLVLQEFHATPRGATLVLDEHTLGWVNLSIGRALRRVLRLMWHLVMYVNAQVLYGFAKWPALAFVYACCYLDRYFHKFYWRTASFGWLFFHFGGGCRLSKHGHFIPLFVPSIYIKIGGWTARG